MDIALILIGLILTLIGIIGCIVPAIPGPPLNYIAIIVLKFVSDESFPFEFILIWGIIVIIITVMDYVLPVLGAKIFGVSKYGIWGSFIGMIVGIIFFPPVGMILGLILGAIAGELIAGKENSEALKAGAASFVLSIFMIIVKLSLSILFTYHFFVESMEIIFG
jgi:uncharacterized protein YqgC (DUF456 family)